MNIEAFNIFAVLVGGMLVMTTCGTDPQLQQRTCVSIQENCKVTETSNGALIECPDSQALVRNGKDGQDGKQGEQGEPGERGEPGVEGQPGPAGADGQMAPAQLIYVGSYCGKLVVRLDTNFYLFTSQPVLLDSQWYKVTNKCEARYNAEQQRIQTRDIDED